MNVLTKPLDSNAKNYSRVVFVEFSSAFNTIDPAILICVMTDITKNVSSWVGSILNQRHQTVKFWGNRL